MKDVEICKRIAEIEGVKAFYGMGPNGETMYTIDEMQYSSLYNPLIDKALCFDLMVRYEIDISRIGDTFYAVAWESEFNDIVCEIQDKNPQRAICLAIIAKHEANNEN